MSQQHSDEVPITFLDVAACFSDDEWKLLNNWQKELYKNVMKEIHQAVISLGPLIATSIFSLRRKEKEDLCQVDHQESKIRGSLISSPIHHMSMEQELEPSLINPYGEEGGEISTGPGLGYMDTAPAASFAIKEERETYSMEHIDSERRESLTSTTGFPFHSSSVKASLRDCYGSEREESSICLNSGPKVTTPVASIGINEEGETYPIDIQLYGIRESISSPAGEGATKRTCKDGDSVKYAKKAFPCKVSSGKTKAKVIQKSETKSHSRSQLWSESNWKLGGGKAIECKSGFRNDVHASLHQGSPKVRRSDKDNECESTLWKAQAFIGQTNTQQSWGSDTFPECEKSFRKNVNFVEHQRSQAESSLEVNYFQCTECDKHFGQKEYLISHQRTHSREKPYHCTECEKSFSHKHHLIGHQRTHSGERPFQCTKCVKSFSWKDSLRRHQRTHTGEKPYLCTKCNISFSWKESLVKHQREHTRLGLPQD